MSEASKAAEEYVVVKKDQIPGEDHLWNDLGLARAHIAGAKALLEWARSKQIYGTNIDGKPTPLGTVNLSELESYFEEEKT